MKTLAALARRLIGLVIVLVLGIAYLFWAYISNGLLGDSIFSPLRAIARVTSPATPTPLINADIATLQNQCLSDFNANREDDAIKSCKALESATVIDNQVKQLISHKSRGKVLSMNDFLKVSQPIRGQSIATYAIATIYAQQKVEPYGRQYAVQAIAWSAFDAKNAHDFIANASKYHYESMLKFFHDGLSHDKTVPDDMEQLYPGVFQEALTSKLHMTREQYDKVMKDL